MKNFQRISAAVFASLVCCVLTLSTPAIAEVLPVKLVGVWVTEKAVLKGDYLFEGQAIYLDTDGVGAVVGGPPPIGIRIVASYRADHQIVAFQLTENGHSVGNGNLMYDSDKKTLRDGKQKVTYYRQSDVISPELRAGLGLEAK